MDLPIQKLHFPKSFPKMEKLNLKLKLLIVVLPLWIEVRLGVTLGD